MDSERIGNNSTNEMDESRDNGQSRLEEGTFDRRTSTAHPSTATTTTAVQLIRMDDAEDENDIPPWHKTDDGKPAWLLNMLSQAAQEEDASEVYKRYSGVSNRSVNKDMFGIKQRS